MTCGECNRPLYISHSSRGTLSYRCSSRSNGYECIGAAILADALEAWVTEEFLARVGTLEVFEHVEVLPDVVALAEVETAISAAAAKMADDDADEVQLSSRLKLLKARRTELKSRPAERVVKLVPTGRTFAETWKDSTDEQRNAILAANVDILSVRKGKRAGTAPVDTGRVTLVMKPMRLPEDAAPGVGRAYVEAA